jgi:hypothetical protein
VRWPIQQHLQILESDIFTRGIQTLSKGTGGDFNSGDAVVCFGMTRGQTSQLTETLQLFYGETISKQMKQDVLQTARMTIPRRSVSRNEFRHLRKDKTIPVQPMRILGVESQKFVEEDVGDGSHAHGGPWMARVCLCRHIDCQATNCVDAPPIELIVAGHCGDLHNCEKRSCEANCLYTGKGLESLAAEVKQRIERKLNQGAVGLPLFQLKKGGLEHRSSTAWSQSVGDWWNTAENCLRHDKVISNPE